MKFQRKVTIARRMMISGSKNFVRHAWLSVAATAVMVVALTVILLAVVLNSTAKAAITEVSKNLKVSVYMKETATEANRQTLTDALKSNQYVADVEYVSVAEAQKKFEESFRNDKQLIEGLTLAGEGTLPASLEISINDLDQISNVAAIASLPEYAPFVDSVSLGKVDAKNTIDRAVGLQRNIIIVGVFAAAIFTVISVLIIFNTIRMAIFSRSEEIAIMKLIGATPNYIRAPFIVEASLYGIVAGILATAGVYTLINSIGSKIANAQIIGKTVDYYSQPSVIALMVLAAMTAGVIVAVLSSLLAMSRYLRLKHW